VPDGKRLVMAIIMIGDKYLASGFRLIGIDTIDAANDEVAAEEVKAAVSEGKHEIIIITERVASRVRALRQGLIKAKKPYPLFVIVPDFAGPIDERVGELRKLVNQATGIKFKVE
jgi:vacuolar-type H+-ATPase subunit F/Vma7